VPDIPLLAGFSVSGCSLFVCPVRSRTQCMNDELQRFAETLSQHGQEQLSKEQENPELEKHLISVALVPLIERAIRLGVTESEFLDECRENWEIQTHPEKYPV
jgi:hypothetical protein